VQPFSFGGLYGTKSKYGDMDITGDGGKVIPTLPGGCLLDICLFYQHFSFPVQRQRWNSSPTVLK
jgi:hypothetical protein